MSNNFFRSILLPFVSCFLILFLFSCTSQQIILTNVEEKDANEIIVLLRSKGIEADKMAVKVATGATVQQKAGQFWDIAVAADKATNALAVLNRIGLPRKPAITLLDVFPSEGLMKTEKEENVRYQEGLNEQIASTIRNIDGIIDVDVQISIPKQNIFNPEAEKEKPTASVYVKHDGVADDPNNLIVQKVKRYVSGSIIDLEYEDVTVITDRARFTDVSLNSLGGVMVPNDYVNVWSITIAKSSVARFRVILFVLCFLLLIFLLAVIWLVWKFQKIVLDVKNLKGLFSPKPMEMSMLQEKKEASEVEESPETEKKEEGEE